ncbi:hypothetical protein BU16DRAFT_565661 [Lophium mytilinum]|uniref:Uncharacterized protein n=1 Tax=Lophium mytilinum TaxID=390894 RepID=A0A6A6QGW9_9PEZI|nr:hypothetical protein BU16DRAFT_565661 [Lophium mytilinum]
MKFAVLLALGATAVAAPAGPEPPTEPSPRVHPISTSTSTTPDAPKCGYKNVRNSTGQQVKNAHCCCFKGDVSYADMEGLLSRSIGDSGLERRLVKSLKGVTLSATSIPFIDWVSVLVPLATPTSSTRKSTFHSKSTITSRPKSGTPTQRLGIHTLKHVGHSSKPGPPTVGPGSHTLKHVGHPSKTGKLPYKPSSKPAHTSSRVYSSKSAVTSSRSTVPSSKIAYSSSKSAYSATKSAYSFSRPSINPSKPTDKQEKPVSYPSKPSLSPTKPAVDVEEPECYFGLLNCTLPGDSTGSHDVDVDIDYELLEIHYGIDHHHSDATAPEHDDYYYTSYSASTFHSSLHWSSPFYLPKPSATFKSIKGKIGPASSTVSHTTSQTSWAKYWTQSKISLSTSSTSTSTKWYSKSVKSTSPSTLTSTSTSSIYVTFTPTHSLTRPILPTLSPSSSKLPYFNHTHTSTRSISSTPTPSPSKLPYSHLNHGEDNLDGIILGVAHDNASEVFGHADSWDEYRCICAEGGKLEFYFGMDYPYGEEK